MSNVKCHSPLPPPVPSEFSAKSSTLLNSWDSPQLFSWLWSVFNSATATAALVDGDGRFGFCQATSALCPFIFSKLKELTATHCSKSNLSKITFNHSLLKHRHCHGQCDCNKSNLRSAKFRSLEIFLPEGDLHFDKSTIWPQMGSTLDEGNKENKIKISFNTDHSPWGWFALWKLFTWSGAFIKYLHFSNWALRSWFLQTQLSSNSGSTSQHRCQIPKRKTSPLRERSSTLVRPVASQP